MNLSNKETEEDCIYELTTIWTQGKQFCGKLECVLQSRSDWRVWHRQTQNSVLSLSPRTKSWLDWKRWHVTLLWVVDDSIWRWSVASSFYTASLTIGLLQQTITWYKIRHAGGQARYYSRTGTSKQRQVKLHWFRSLCFNVPVRE